MGVHGLTTYLRENRRSLCENLEFPNSKNASATPVVVDGWSFIYHLYYQSGLPWVYGGEYDAFSTLVQTVVQSWIDVGLSVHFVFDGPAPELKFPTLLSRMDQTNVNAQLFFRTSAISRSTRRFLHESRILPPLCYAACLQGLQAVALMEKALQLHFADEEADPYAVELAGRVGGYVMGNDSDFAIFNSDGYLGYIPLEDMVWSAAITDDDTINEDGDFQPVRKGKGKQKKNKDVKFGKGLIPPDVQFGSTLFCIAYSPCVLATHFSLPVTLLPLLGALVGNDFSGHHTSMQRNVQPLFFDRQLSLSQRITRVASTLQSILSASLLKKKQKQVGSVVDLIEKTVNALLIRSASLLGSGEIAAIVEKIVEATLQYAIPKYERQHEGVPPLWPTDVCALHEPEACPLLPLFSRFLCGVDGEESEEVNTRNRVRALYLNAYREGQLFPKIMDILDTKTYWPRFFLENPDVESVGRSISRTIRQWGYSILDNGVGLPERVEELDDTIDEDDEDELIDVAEEDSDEGDEDPLAPLRGALEQLHMPDDKRHAPSTSRSRSVCAGTRKFVAEYVRRGTKFSQEDVVVPELSELLSSISVSDITVPIQLLTEDERLTIFLQVLNSDFPHIKALPPEQLVAVLTLRLIVRIFSQRALESGGNKEKQLERWTKQEARSFLASFSWCTPSEVTAVDPPPIVNRNVQLTAQVMMAMECVLHFSQILLLTERVRSPVHLLSGRTFHEFLTGQRSIGAEHLSEATWEALTEGLEEPFAQEQRKKSGKEKKRLLVSSPVQQNEGHGSANGGLFGLLGDADA